MAREINKNEKYFFSDRKTLEYDFWSLDSLKKNDLKANASNYFEKLLAFNLESAEDPALKNSPFWYTSTAYLTFIAKDYKKANEFLQKAKVIPTENQGLKDQIAMQEMILAVSESPEVTPKMEATVMPLLERFTRSDKFRSMNLYANRRALRPQLAAGSISMTVRPRIRPIVTASMTEGSSPNLLTLTIAARWRGRRWHWRAASARLYWVCRT